MRVEADTRFRDADMGTKAQNFYEEYFSESIKSERGETWFTPIALLENIYDIKNKLIDSKGTLKQYKKELISNISNNIIKDMNLGVNYHCLANFGCIPVELNKWRGGQDFKNKENPLFNRRRLGDFPDLFFICIKNYLTNQCNDGYKPDIEGKKLKEFDYWFEKIGEGKKCSWEEFVNKMHLKYSFVDENYEVVKLFEHSIDKPFPELKGIFEDNLESKYTINELSNILSEDSQIRECIININNIWNKRAAYLQELRDNTELHDFKY